MKASKQLILEINDLKTNKEYMVKCQFSKDPVKHRCLGNYGNGDKVYMTKACSTETAISMVEKFENNQMPNCFVVWDYMLKNTYQITNV